MDDTLDLLAACRAQIDRLLQIEPALLQASNATRQHDLRGPLREILDGLRALRMQIARAEDPGAPDLTIERGHGNPSMRILVDSVTIGWINEVQIVDSADGSQARIGYIAHRPNKWQYKAAHYPTMETALERVVAEWTSDNPDLAQRTALNTARRDTGPRPGDAESVREAGISRSEAVAALNVWIRLRHQTHEGGATLSEAARAFHLDRDYVRALLSHPTQNLEALSWNPDDATIRPL